MGLTFQMRLNWKIFDLSHNPMGDIDAAVSFDNNESIFRIFPANAKFLLAERIRSLSSRHFVAEFKRSCPWHSHDMNV